LYGWKENSMLTNCLAACTHLSSTVSQLFEPQVQKNRHFHVQQPTFLFPLEMPLRLSRNMLHGWKDNLGLPNPSQHVPIYLQQFPSYLNRKCQKSPFLRTTANIFVSPGDAPGAITLNVVWMEREIRCLQLSRCMCPSNYNCF